MAAPIRQLDIVGLGISQTPVFTEATQACIAAADYVIGSERQLALLSVEEKPQQQQWIELPKLSELKALIDDLASDKSVVVLASGDPLFYGIGRWFKQNFSEAFEQGRLCFHPAVSSIQAACHRLGFSLQDTDVLSLHGRPLAKLRTQLKANRTLAILTDQHSNPMALAKECKNAGFGDSRLTVCERLGYDDEQCRSFSAKELVDSRGDGRVGNKGEFDPLHVTIIEVKGLGGVLPSFPGFADTLFETGAEPGKGMISKREVRLCILSYLEPNNDDVIWDIGAGCGGVAVELAYWNEKAKVYAIEHHSERLKYLAINRERFGVVSNMHIVEGRAPACLTDLSKPTKVFIGGSDGALPELLAQCWELLPVGGILVASAVIQSTKDQLNDFAELLACSNDSGISTQAIIESTEVAVKRGQMVAGELVGGKQADGKLVYQSKYPVTVFQYKKFQFKKAAK
ncbi:precorrin-6y C5,15-methyltransferase (decarboxylating) subunit CbiE [Litoribrevibacter euphylliae]|uniref:Precorrin-6y C5,15-methyltransferase (Decarboxylating) subunit CbiE n=1 Tax=Litoribrevibacter euphylliae TaxID=1834034 RepID=A0ABV7HAV6_9GAMM